MQASGKPVASSRPLASPLEVALERLTIPELWRLLDLAGTPKQSCRSPFREDKTPSFSIYDGGRRWKDHGTDEEGDAADFVAKAHNLSKEDGARKLIEITGVRREAVGKSTSHESKEYDPFRDVRKAAQRAKWPAFDVPTHAEIAAIGELRGLCPEGISLAAEAGLLFTCESREGRAWVVTDSRRINAQARRLDGQCWAAQGDAKSWTLPGSVGSWPIGLREARCYPAIALVEGAPDLLTGFHLAWCAGQENSVVPVAMLGASMAILTPALPLFAGKRVRIFAHRDQAGLKAEARWWRQLTQASIEVDRFNFTGFVTGDGEPVGDLNDFAHIDVDQWEGDRQAIDEAFVMQ